MGQHKAAPPFEPFGERLRRIRVQRNFPHESVAHRANVPERVLREMEDADEAPQALLDGLAIAEALDVDPTYLVFGVPGLASRKIVENDDAIRDLRERIEALERTAR